MVTTVAAIETKLYHWAGAIAAGYVVQFEDEDLPNKKGPRVDLHIENVKQVANPTVTVVVPVPGGNGVEHIVAECQVDVRVNVRATGAGAMATALKLIASLKSGQRFVDAPAGLWQIMGLGGVISDPTDLSALESGATLSRVEFRVRFHAAIEFTDSGDYIKTTLATISETEKGTVATVTLGPNPHPIPAECN